MPSDEVFTREFGYDIVRDVVDKGGRGWHKGRGSSGGHGRGRGIHRIEKKNIGLES
jgi:hypothetical protein